MAVDQWWNFFYLCGSAAATLTGLMFIAVTFGSGLIRKDTASQVHVFLSPLCLHFLHVFFLCCITAVPGANPALVATAAMVSALWRLVKIPRTCMLIHRLAKNKETGIDCSDWVLLVFFPAAVYLAMIAAGVGFLLGKSWAVSVLAASCLVLLMGAARGAWDTLIWIAVALRLGPNEPVRDEQPKT